MQCHVLIQKSMCTHHNFSHQFGCGSQLFHRKQIGILSTYFHHSQDEVHQLYSPLDSIFNDCIVIIN